MTSGSNSSTAKNENPGIQPVMCNSTYCAVRLMLLNKIHFFGVNLYIALGIVHCLGVKESQDDR